MQLTRPTATWLQQADHMPNYSDLISGYSRLIICRTIRILFRVTAGRSQFRTWRNACDCWQNHHGCRQNKLRLLWNALLTTPYVSEHYKYMFLFARDLYEMLVLYREKHTSRRSTVGIWSEVRVYRTPIHKYTVGRLSAVGQVSRQTAIEVLRNMLALRLQVPVSTNKPSAGNYLRSKLLASKWIF